MHVTGNLDSSTFMAFRERAEELIRDGARFILVDLGNCPYVSTAGFAALHHLFNVLRSQYPEANLSDEKMREGVRAGTFTSPHLKLLNLSREARTAFEMIGFDMYIETFTDMKRAVAAF
jgi:ABC-type transporter Mla MlaB component